MDPGSILDPGPICRCLYGFIGGCGGVATGGVCGIEGNNIDYNSGLCETDDYGVQGDDKNCQYTGKNHCQNHRNSVFNYCDIYAAVQRQYWNVGAFRYFQIKQIPNFLLATPIIIISFFTFYYFSSRLLRDARNKITGNYAVLKQGEKRSIWSTLSLCFYVCLSCLQSPLSSHLLHLLAVTMLGIIVAHIQIVTRLICSSCPVIYIGLAVLLVDYSRPTIAERERNTYRECSSQQNTVTEQSEDSLRFSREHSSTGIEVQDPLITVENISNVNSQKNLLNFKYVPYFVISYIILFNFLGIVLHPNFYPWT